MPLENEKIEVAEEKETEMPNVEELLKILLDVNLEQNRQTVHLLMNYMNDIEENFFSVLEELDTVNLCTQIFTNARNELYLNMHYFTDMARLGAQVVAGIGFIGAGTIIVTKRQRVKGLTTAAGLWTSAIIGLTFGGGFYEGGILATVFIMLAELVFSRIEYRVLENVPEINLYMEYEDKHCLDDVLQLYRSCNIKVLNIQITRSAENGEHNACAIFSLRLPRSCGVEKLLTLVGKCEGIVSVEEL